MDIHYAEKGGLPVAMMRNNDSIISPTLAAVKAGVHAQIDVYVALFV